VQIEKEGLECYFVEFTGLSTASTVLHILPQAVKTFLVRNIINHVLEGGDDTLFKIILDFSMVQAF
jgi:hypothetical protein